MNDEKMTISMEAYGKETIVKIPVDCNIYEAIEACNTCLLGATFSQNAILRGMQEFLEEKGEFNDVKA